MANLGRIHKRFEQNSNERRIKATLTITDFLKRQIFAKNGEFDKRLSNVWQKLISELTKRKNVKIWVPFEIEPRVVPDLMVLK